MKSAVDRFSGQLWSLKYSCKQFYKLAPVSHILDRWHNYLRQQWNKFVFIAINKHIDQIARETYVSKTKNWNLIILELFNLGQ